MKLDIVLIKNNILLFLLSILLFFSLTTYSFTTIKKSNAALESTDLSICSELKFNNSLEKIDFIEINFDNYRKWSKNALKILSLKDNKRFIPEKLKKRHTAKIIVHYIDNNNCLFKAKIRQNGDHFDHIQLKNGNIIQSLDVHLERGNISGITKFKLFITSTRNADSEIIISKLLNDLGYISPKTSYVKTLLNNNKTIFLFQEKASKELIERSRFKDAPIYEGNENLIVGTSKNEKVIFNKKLTFVKQVNSKWINTNLREKIAIEGLTRLNEVYFKNISFFKDKTNKVDQLTLDYNLLANGDKQHYDYLLSYDALVSSVNGGHSLIPHNRKFYYEPYSSKFYPVFYDGSPGSTKRKLFGGWTTKIRKLNENEFKWGVSDNAILGANIALFKLKKLDNEKIYNDLKKYGVNYNKNEFFEILKAIEENLITISKIKILKKELTTKIQDYLNFAKHDSIDFNIFYSMNDDHYICKTNNIICSKFNLNQKNFQKLINGEYINDKKILIFRKCAIG